MSGDLIVLGFDGSRKRHYSTTDATVVTACRVEDGHFFQPETPGGLRGVWEEPAGVDDWQVPAEEVDGYVRWVFDTYNVVGFFADPNLWESYIAVWEGEWGETLPVKATAKHPIEWWPEPKKSTLAVEAFYQAINNKELSHDGHPAITQHVRNAYRKPTTWGVSIQKEHPSSKRKIDGCMAMVICWQARLAAISARTTSKGGRVV